MGYHRSFTVTFDDGSTLDSSMNGKITDDEIRRYYIGTPFTNEDHNGVESTRTGVSVQIHPDTLSCPTCGMHQPPNTTTADNCHFTKTCGKPLDKDYSH